MSAPALINKYLNFVEWPSFSVTIGSLAVCMTYYFMYIGKKPQLIGKPQSKFKAFLLQHCPIFDEYFWPTFWCFGGRAQSIVGSLLKSHPVVSYRRELLETPDGGELYLDWLDNGSLESDNPSSYPTVLILPGLTGTSQNGYTLHFVKQIERHGYRTVVMNNRGLGGAKLRTPRSFCAANTEDLEFVIKHIQKACPGAPLVAVGVSLGGLILTNYLAKCGRTQSPGLKAAMIVSVPMNVFLSSKSLEEPLNAFLINRHLANMLCRLVKEHLPMFEVLQKQQPRIQLHQVLKSRTVRQFDESLIAPMFGYKDSDDYYTAASLHTKPLHEISIPLLCLSSGDDPFAPLESLPLDKIQTCPNVIMALTDYGGHIGFTEGLLPTGAGFADRVMTQYVRAVFENGHSLITDND